MNAKKKDHYKYHYARPCETFDNKLLFTLTESAGATNNNVLGINNNDNNNNNNINFHRTTEKGGTRRK